jgi:putative tryptophan/tyrosine transport system substrate-binding protein
VISRRCFLVSIGVASTPIGSIANAQENKAERVPRIGYLTSETRSVNVDAFELGLRELGYVNGQNIMVEYRYGEGRVDRLPALVDELLRVGVDVFLAASPFVIRAARQATGTVPIVGIDLETDPMEAGWVKSFAKPGGNLTGFFLDIPELGGKQLQLLAETVPRLQRVAVLWDARIASSQFKATESAARRTKFGLQSLAFRGPEEFVGAFEAARNQQAQALLLLTSPSVFIHQKRLADLALQYRLPTISIFPQFVSAGGLMGYGPNLPDLFRRAADYVDRILKGARAADLPIQRPAVFKLAVNLKTAKVLGITIPESLLVRADEVIQ